MLQRGNRRITNEGIRTIDSVLRDDTPVHGLDSLSHPGVTIRSVQTSTPQLPPNDAFSYPNPTSSSRFLF